MNSRNRPQKIKINPPSIFSRLYSIWFRHFRVYTRHIISNGFPPFIEPLFFLAGVGLGLGQYVGLIDGTPYIYFLAAGIIAPPAMFTASFECTFGTFIRLEFDKAYDGMISSSLTIKDIFIILNHIKNFKTIHINGNYADKELINYVKTNRSIIGTMDKELKKQIKQSNSSILSFSQDKIVLED